MKDLLDNLNNMQREAVKNTDGPLLILAGAGTGKTRVITYRIAYLLSRGVLPQNILAITFTNKAAGEMKSRVLKLASGSGDRVWLTTFHSFAAQLLRIEAKNAGLNRNYAIYDETDQKNLIKQCLKELNIDDKKYRVGVFLDAISRSKDDLIDAGSYAIYSVAGNDILRHTTANVYSLYQKKLNLSNALDFGDLLLKCVDLLHSNANVCEKYQSRFKYILVDEYQDTNRAQYVMLKYLAAKSRNLCVVGDDDQSIYSWRGADVKNILGFEKDYPDAKVIKLEQNYRSTRNILNCAWNVIKNNNFRKEKKLWSLSAEGEDIKIQGFQDEILEANFVAKEIKKLLSSKKDICFSDFAVFYRTNAQSRVFEDIFRRERIPYIIVGSVRFYERKEVKDVLSYIRVALNTADEMSLRRIINMPHRGIGDTTLKMFESYARLNGLTLWKALEKATLMDLPPRLVRNIYDFIGLIERLRQECLNSSPVEVVKKAMEESGYLSMLEEDNSFESKERIRNLRELVSAVGEYGEAIQRQRGGDAAFQSSSHAQRGGEENNDGSIGGFLSNVALLSGVDEWDAGKKGIGGESVTLMTLHLAKGLEFDTVFICGMEEGLFPLGASITDENPQELEEERRLAYVGITRAKKKVFMNYAETRRLYGQIRWNLPSRFIEEAKNANNYSNAHGREFTDRIDENTFFNFKVGDRIKHPDFGAGRIIAINGSEDMLKVTISFADGSTRKILAKYANMEQI